MKKIIIASLVSAVSFSSASFAKTEGSYVGFNLLKTTAETKEWKGSRVSPSVSPMQDSSNGYGLEFKHAFNFGNQMFISPGVFYDHLGNKIKDKPVSSTVNGVNLANDSVSVKSRYGIKADFGYDVTDNFAAYLTAGLASVKYGINWDSKIVDPTDLVTVSSSSSLSKKGRKMGAIYGAGFSFYPTKDVSVNVEYNMQSLDFKAPDVAVKAPTKLKTMKVGVAYHF